MKIESVTIRGFRCFGPVGQAISFDNLSCFIGPNASGKTAAMMALARLFGETQNLRQITTGDFHLVPGEKLNDKPLRVLSIECRISCDIPDDDESASPTSLPEIFNQMIVDTPDGDPYCRIILEATWENDNTPLGDIHQSLSWIQTSSDVISDEHKQKLTSAGRSLIRVLYIPATRDPAAQIHTTTTSIFGRLLNAIVWAGTSESVKVSLKELQDQLKGLTGVQTMNSEVQKTWDKFYEGRVAREVGFQALDEDPMSLIKKLVPSFRPGDDGRTMSASDLSDGLRSLFSLTLSLGLFRVEELLRTTAEASGFKSEIVETLPSLTLFAIEEPENHLSPHYLGRIVSEFSLIAETKNVQVLISSHSPSILGRILPDNVRYFLGHEHSTETEVRHIPLPEDKSDESYKFVREAVRGYPELYFSRLVILGEGPSEEIVLRRLFEASGTNLDMHYISIVPLGGRHVNHFWRLLHGLDIPFLTLLDLDREKDGAGWGRIQYVRDQLVRRFGDDISNLRNLEKDEYNNLFKNKETETENMNEWISFFEKTFDVYFSFPLDLDFSLLEAFSSTYMKLPCRPGPRLPKTTAADYKSVVSQRMKQVLAADSASAPDTIGSTYTEQQQVLFPWYKYLFVDGSKPVTHMQAMLQIENQDLISKSPTYLKNLVNRAAALVAPDVE